ncbi:MAG: protocatechuate 3,4-dioxygenase [Pseudomonadota bacterium]
MTIEKSKISRRGFFMAGLGAAGTMAASETLAKVCGAKTGEQGLGPFFPRPGTPEDEVNETNDPMVPIFLSNDNDLTFVKGRKGIAQGQQVIIEGVVQDLNCQPIAGATVIIWQASASGRYNHKGDSANQDFKDPRTGKIIERRLDPSFQSWGQATTDKNGRYEFKTIVPGFYPADLQGGWYRPPHIHFMVSATGRPQFVTQMYFRGEEILDNEFVQELNQADFLLQGKNLTLEQREKLIVDFEAKENAEELFGSFDLNIE